MEKPTKEDIRKFLMGGNPLFGVVTVSVKANNDYAIIHRRDNGAKMVERIAYKPFLWATKRACTRLFNGNRLAIAKTLKEFNIECIGLDSTGIRSFENADIRECGYSVMFRAKIPMSWNVFLSFFKVAGNPVSYGSDEKQYLTIPREQQFLIDSGIRYYKGFNDYNDVVRAAVSCLYNSNKLCSISVKTNTNDYFEYCESSEIDTIVSFLRGLTRLNPDVIVGYDNESIWNEMESVCKKNGMTLSAVTKDIFSLDGWVSGVKIGENVEDIKQARISFGEVTDAYYGIRRAQAADSDFRSSDLDYAASYLKTGGEDCLGKTLSVDYSTHLADYQLCKILPVPFQECCIMGPAAQWKLLLLAWFYEKGLAIPPFKKKESFVGGLSKMFKIGRVTKVFKFDYHSMYPSILLTWKIPEREDYSGAMISFLDYVLTSREDYKRLSSDAEAKVDEKDLPKEDVNTEEYLHMLYMGANMSFKRLGVSFFGMYGAPQISPFASTENAELTTCIGRQCLRLMVSHFKRLGYEPIVGDTDGINWCGPSNYRYSVTSPYVGKGVNRYVVKGQEYVGYEADVAEFNELYFNNSAFDTCRMGLGIDERIDAEICLSRKNYVNYYSEKGNIHMTGNIMKSRALPDYIVEFLDKGVRMLLKGDGKGFVEYYYDTIEQIYNFRIPLRKIAMKGKVKKSLEDYRKDCDNNPDCVRQAWMELAMQNNKKVSVGDVLYYINTGEGVNCSDVSCEYRYFIYDSNGEKKDISARVNKDYAQYRKDAKNNGVGDMDLLSRAEFIGQRYRGVEEERKVRLQSILLTDDDLSKDTYSSPGREYNPSKYIELLNKRIQPFLVCFNPQVAERILVSKPSDRPWLSVSDCALSEGIQSDTCDTYEELMIMDEREKNFWRTHPEFEPPFLRECDMTL